MKIQHIHRHGYVNDFIQLSQAKVTMIECGDTISRQLINRLKIVGKQFLTISSSEIGPILRISRLVVITAGGPKCTFHIHKMY